MADDYVDIDPPAATNPASASGTKSKIRTFIDASSRRYQAVVAGFVDTNGTTPLPVSKAAPLPTGYGQLQVISADLGGAVSTTPNYSGWDQIGAAATIWDGSGTAAIWEIKEVIVDIDEAITGLAAGEGLELVVWGSDATVVLSSNNAELDADTVTGAVIPLTQTRNGYQAGGDRWQATGLSVVPFGSSGAGVYTGSTYLAAALRYKGSTAWAFSSATALIGLNVLVRRVG